MQFAASGCSRWIRQDFHQFRRRRRRAWAEGGQCSCGDRLSRWIVQRQDKRWNGIAGCVPDRLDSGGRGTPQIVVVSRSDTVRSAIDTMQRYGISQIPVVTNGTAASVSDIVGSVQERTMLDRVFREPALVDATVERVMEAPFPVVQANEDVERLYAELAGGVPALLAVDDGRPVSVITKADLLEFVAHQRRASR